MTFLACHSKEYHSEGVTALPGRRENLYLYLYQLHSDLSILDLCETIIRDSSPPARNDRPIGPFAILARIFHELLSRDREDDRATWQPQGVGSEAYLERYVAGADIRGRQEERPYPRSQQVIHEISGLRESHQRQDH
jgi:hypothetical protein